MSTTYTQSDLDKLEQALLRKTKRVQFADGRSVEFSTFEELAKRIDYVRRQLAVAGAETRKLAEFTKGVQS